MNRQDKIAKIKSSIATVLVGKEEMTELVVISILARGHILLEDVPGTGKTMLAKSIAKCLDAKFRRVQFTPDVLPSDVTGIQFFNPKEQAFELRPGPVMTNILLADEINRATPRTQSSLLEVMEERQVTIDGETLPLPKPFIVIATQNPIDSQQGTFSLPEAQMDRFLLLIKVGYPTLAEEKQMLSMYRESEPIDSLEVVLTIQEIEEMQNELKKVTLSEDIETYMLKIIAATRQSEYVEVGVSPRGTLGLMRAIQARAYIHGRDYCLPEDVKVMAPYVLSHRLVLSIEGSMRKTKEDVLMEILKSVEVPVEAGAVR
ncbi:AAA family ATPase [Anaerobacillus isosaccharinicus]|uniref:Magnesium chelatase n=1 Tax=Anaerobacillus isosaccharinicus TaxID=1532552 RepID=A0A1S2KTQ6_9BACI|nr:MoxR family ATPase [Anaerobacillus isosaccharinicus]MBA5588051.1 MoxR family ATPase [Anaerobacillus isosaccharinicus]QOY33809.1 MoxR family ATPase [Anaerobacillus isosaccharinicus]